MIADSPVPEREQGFTLIELLVALSIFAMLSVAGVMLMRGSVSVQGAVAEHLDADARLMRVHAIIRHDLEQVVPRITRTTSGLLAPSFFGRKVPDPEPIVQFVRSGVQNLDAAPRSDLQKIEYLYRDGRLERQTYPMLDGTAPREPALLLDDIEQLSISYRARTGEWQNVWQKPGASDLPVAVRLTFKLKGGHALTWLFLVAPGEARPGDEEVGTSPDA